MFRYFYTMLLISCVLNLNVICKRVKTRRAKTQLRVMEGRNAREGEFPYVTVVYERPNVRLDLAYRLCTASYITEFWTITAGHCVYGLKPYSIFLSHTNFTKFRLFREIARIKRIVVHPAFQYREGIRFMLRNDIALLLAERRIAFGIAKLLPVDHKTMIGLRVQYVGAGGTRHPKNDALRPIQVGEGGIVRCDGKEKMLFQIICIVPRCTNPTQMPWYGDSGGPLVYDRRVMGVCSYSTNTSRWSDASFAPVSPYIDWMYRIIKNIQSWRFQFCEIKCLLDIWGSFICRCDNTYSIKCLAIFVKYWNTNLQHRW